MRPRGAREKRWVVREGDGVTIADILRRAGEPESAVEEGRVFLGRARVKSGAERVKLGDEVKIGSAAPGDAALVIWQQDGLIACAKPAGIPTVPDHRGASHSLVALAAQSIGKSAADLFVTSRLDREVSGVVVFATQKEAEGRLRSAREQGRYARRYVALVSGESRSSDRPGVWDEPIGDGTDPLHRAVAGPGAKPALTHWALVARAGTFAMVAVEPQTGRTHQIRVHASHAGMPLLGDRDYGGPSRITLPNGRTVALTRIALHAARVTVPSSRGESLVASAPAPPELARVWSDLGGAAEAWDRAVSCEVGP